MHRSSSARYFSLACWSVMVVLGLTSCGNAGANPDDHVTQAGAHTHHTDALNEDGEFSPSDNHRFSWEVEWLSGPPVATEKASARLTFQNAEGAAAGKLVIKSLDLIMVCCRESGSGKPQLESEAGMNPASRDVGNIIPTKSGQWKLKVTAEVDGGEVDTASWVFNVAKP